MLSDHQGPFLVQITDAHIFSQGSLPPLQDNLCSLGEVGQLMNGNMGGVVGGWEYGLSLPSDPP